MRKKRAAMREPSFSLTYKAVMLNENFAVWLVAFAYCACAIKNAVEGFVVSIKKKLACHEADGCLVYSVKLVDIAFHLRSAVCAAKVVYLV